MLDNSLADNTRLQIAAPIETAPKSAKIIVFASIRPQVSHV
jgi:hypothetical protein